MGPLGTDPTAPIGLEAAAPVAASSDVTTSFGAAGPDATERLTTVPAAPASPDDSSVAIGALGAGPTVLVVLLALATAGAFLPAWDHYSGVATASGRVVSFNLGDAFSGPWQVVIGTVFVAVVLVAVPVLATRMRSRAVGATLVAGSLIVLATQFTSALVQVDNTVPPSVAGLSPSQANQLGLHLHMTLTSWFTLDLLAAFALFVAAMLLGHVRESGSEASTVGPWPSHPYVRETATLPPS
jgi:hypothetical protein